MCVKLSDCRTTKPLCMGRLISAPWLRRPVVFVDQLHPLHLRVTSNPFILNIDTPMCQSTFLCLRAVYFSVLYNTCLLGQTCRYARTKLMSSSSIFVCFSFFSLFFVTTLHLLYLFVQNGSLTNSIQCHLPLAIF